MFQEMLENVRGKCPLIHNITNYVTVNDCANIVLACGASPIMSDDQSEVEEITTICGGLNINIGTLNKRTIESMFLAGKRANALNHPAVLDPVGAGASRLRTDTANRLMQEVRFDAVRGNISEIKTLCTGSGSTIKMQLDAVPANKWPHACLGCGACAAVCPQKIDIPGQLAAFAAELDKLPDWVEVCRQRAEAEARERASRGL